MAYEQMFANFSNESFAGGVMGGLAGGALGGMLVALGIISILIFIAIYIYFALAWMTIAKKKKYKYPWLAWIPFANLAMILQLGLFHWAWIFLLLIPVIGWLAVYVLLIIATWRIFESLKYPGWLALFQLIDVVLSGVGTIVYLVIIGVVAWRKK